MVPVVGGGGGTAGIAAGLATGDGLAASLRTAVTARYGLTIP